MEGICSSCHKEITIFGDLAKSLCISCDEFLEKKKEFKKKLHAALSGCEFNGAGMRQLLDEFSGEVTGN